MKQVAVFLVAALLLFALPVSAQDEPENTGEIANAQGGVEILWPPPVTEVWGVGDVIGTAAVPGMAYYYLEILSLNADMSLPEGAPWIPVTIGVEEPVFNDRLATLDTTMVPDGLYALRLIVNTMDGESYFDQVMPIRVSNERFIRVTDRIREAITGEIATLLQGAGVDLAALLSGEEAEATPAPEPTPEPESFAPRAFPAEGIFAANMRRCDVVDNYSCAIVGTMTTDGAAVTAISANGTGWYQVVLQTGQSGWVSPTVTTVTGDVSTLPFVSPPVPLPPPAAANLVLNGISPQGTPTCNQRFDVWINVANVGNAPSQGGTVTLQDVNTRTGDITFTGYGNVPSINPGGNFVVVIPVGTNAFYNETHELRAYIGDQRITHQYVLNQGNCDIRPTPIPPDPVNQRDIPPGQCFLVLTNPKVVFDTPYGNPQGTVDPAPYEANRVRLTNNALWYRMQINGIGRVWMAGDGVEKQGNCDL